MSFSISTAVNPSSVFIVEKTKATGRWDPHYHSPRFERLDTELNEIGANPIHKVSCGIFSGVTPVSGGDAYTVDPDGIAFIRSGDFNDDGSINESDLIRLKPAVHQKLMRRSQLKAHDVLFAIVGATIGKVGIFPGGYEANINQAVCAVRLMGNVQPHFLHAFFLTRLGQEQIERVKRPVARANINLEEVGMLRVPVLDEKIQWAVVDALKVAFSQKVATETKASQLLATIDDMLLDELGIPRVPEPPNTLESRIFKRSVTLVSGERYDPHFHSPKFGELICQLRKVPHATLRDLVTFSGEQWDQEALFLDTFPYIEISAVDLMTGRLTEPVMVRKSEAASRAKMIVRPGDLLISLTRPTRRAICFAPHGIELAIASNGFAVVRGVRTPDLNIRYLFHVLRSRLCTAQFDQRSSGGNYPAITEEQLSKIIIPLIEADKQKDIVERLDAIYMEADRLFITAHAELERAKRDIEALILGEGVKK